MNRGAGYVTPFGELYAVRKDLGDIPISLSVVDKMLSSPPHD
jgi:hypothetical protein